MIVGIKTKQVDLIEKTMVSAHFRMSPTKGEEYVSPYMDSRHHPIAAPPQVVPTATPAPEGGAEPSPAPVNQPAQPQPNIAEWLGNSQVRTPEGTPQPVLPVAGTANTFTTDPHSMRPDGADPVDGQPPSDQPLFLRVNNPLNADNRLRPSVIRKMTQSDPPLLSALAQATISRSRASEGDWGAHVTGHDVTTALRMMGREADLPHVLQRAGYDGMTHLVPGPPAGDRHWIVTDPEAQVLNPTQAIGQAPQSAPPSTVGVQPAPQMPGMAQPMGKAVGDDQEALINHLVTQHKIASPSEIGWKRTGTHNWLLPDGRFTRDVNYHRESAENTLAAVHPDAPKQWQSDDDAEHELMRRSGAMRAYAIPIQGEPGFLGLVMHHKPTEAQLKAIGSVSRKFIPDWEHFEALGQRIASGNGFAGLRSYYHGEPGNYYEHGKLGKCMVIIKASGPIEPAQPSQPAQPFYSNLRNVIETHLPDVVTHQPEINEPGRVVSPAKVLPNGKVLPEKRYGAKMQPARTPADQVRDLIGTHNIHPAEVQYGLGDYLDRHEGDISKQELLAHIDQNLPQMQDVWKGHRPVTEWEQRGNEYHASDGYVVRPGNGEGHWDIQSPNGTTQTVYANNIDQIKRVAAEGNLPQPTKYQNYTLPGGENYRELLMTLPLQPEMREFTKQTFGQNYDRLPPAVQERIRQEFEQSNGKSHYYQPSYKSSHWDEPNVLAHLRMNDRTDAEGKRALHLEEVQSDWSKSLRKAREKASGIVDRDFNKIVDSLKNSGALEVRCE